jgi:hypothetical protein
MSITERAYLELEQRVRLQANHPIRYHLTRLFRFIGLI